LGRALKATGAEGLGVARDRLVDTWDAHRSGRPATDDVTFVLVEVDAAGGIESSSQQGAA
jgi:hypothetical protein